MGTVGLVGYLFWAASGGLVREGNWVGVDFHVYYQAAQVLSRSGDIYSAGISPPYVYPPLLAGLVIPLTALSVTAATIFWKLLQHVCLILAGALLVNLLPARIRPMAAGLLMLGWLTTPVQDEMQVGESNSIILLLSVGAIWLILRRKKTKERGIKDGFFLMPLFLLPLAGVLLALAVSIKVLPALLVAYLWWRGPRKVAAVATGGFVILQLIMLALTPSTARYWLVEFPGLFGQAFPYPDNQSINAFFSRALLPTDPGLPSMQLADGEALRAVLTWIANMLVAFGAVWVLRKAGRHSTEKDQTGRLLLEVGLVLLTTHLVSGSTWLHHMVALAVPLAALIGAWWLKYEEAEGRDESYGHRLRDRTLLLAILIGATLAVLLHRPSEWLSVVGGIVPGNPLVALVASSSAMWAVVAVWVAVASTLLRHDATRNS